MRNKKVWMLAVLSLLIITGLGLVFIANSSRGVYSSMFYTVIVFFSTVAFLLVIAYIYKAFFQPKKYGVATVTKRFWAFALDYLFLHIFLHVLSVIVVIFSGNFKIYYNTLMTTLYGGRDEWFVTELGIMGVYCLYSTIMDFKGGTLGRKAMDGIVISNQMTRPSFVQQLTRNLVKWVMFIPVLFLFFMPFLEVTSYEFYLIRFFLVVYIYPKLNPERLFLQDFIAGTKVLDTKYGLQTEIK